MEGSSEKNPTRCSPLEARREVTENNQIQLPIELVEEVGYRSEIEPDKLKTMWYYHEGEVKAVLAGRTVDRPTLDSKAKVKLSNIKYEDLESDNDAGARVTISSELPTPLVKRLTQGRVVLRPVYAAHHPRLSSTCVSVYPEREYDCGKLPNVDRETNVKSDETAVSEDTPIIEEKTSHQNSI